MLRFPSISRQAPGGAKDCVSEASPQTMALAPLAVGTERASHQAPILVSIADARTISGLSRSAIYRQMAAGNIRSVKAGSRTLIVLQSLVQHLESLPPATFRRSG